MYDLDDVEMVACSICGGLFPPTLEFFYAEPTNTNGMKTYCKDCGRAKARKRYTPIKRREHKSSAEVRPEHNIENVTQTSGLCPYCNHFWTDNKKHNSGLFCSKECRERYYER